MARFFVDTQERKWVVAVDATLAGRLRQERRVNCAELLFSGAHWHAVTADRGVFIAALFTVVYEQCQQRRMGQDDLERCLDARSLRFAVAVFGFAVYDYLPRDEQQRYTRIIAQQRHQAQVRQAQARRPKPPLVTIQGRTATSSPASPRKSSGRYSAYRRETMSLSDENKLILKHRRRGPSTGGLPLADGGSAPSRRNVEVRVTIDTGPIAIAIAEGIANFRATLAQVVTQVIERLNEQPAPEVEVTVTPKIELHRTPRTIRITHSDGLDVDGQ